MFRDALLGTTGEAETFVQGFEELNERFLDVVYDNERLQDQPEPLLRNLVELSQRKESVDGDQQSTSVSVLEDRLLEAVGPERRNEALELIETGRVSWKLRDDDNLLVARLESQLLRALGVAAKRLRQQSRLTGDEDVQDSHAALLTAALREPSTGPIQIVSQAGTQPRESAAAAPGETPRQLIGQPASPGVATGTVRCIQGRDDLGKFRQGEILVCDAIQPTMTHLVPLAGAIVERRGGMLIHGAIIARELGIPCVNGVHQAADILRNGDFITVDGYLGIVTVGAPEFDLEFDGIA